MRPHVPVPVEGQDSCLQPCDMPIGEWDSHKLIKW